MENAILLTEVNQRSKSNTHQIEELKCEIKEMKENQKAIYELTTSVKLMAQDMSSIKESVEEVEKGQNKLSERMDEQITDIKCQIKDVDSKSKLDLTRYFRDKLLPWILGGGALGAVLKLIEYLDQF